MFKVKNNNILLLFESPFKVADYIYSKTHNLQLSKSIIDDCEDMFINDGKLIEPSFTVDGEYIFIRRIS